MVNRFLILAAIVTLSCRANKAAFADRVIHVAPHGDDAADGSAAHPLKSLHEAQRRVRDRLAADDSQAVRVELAAGDYVLMQPLVLTPADSGKSAENPVVWAAAAGDVQISGGQQITGWRVDDDGWVAKLPPANVDEPHSPAPFRQLWVNGRRAIRARAPNDGFFRIERAGPDNRTSFIVQSDDLLSLAKPELAEVTFLHDWSISRVRLASIDPATRTYHFADPIGARLEFMAISGFEPQPRYRIENAAELLDAPGEWLFEENTRELRYKPRDGETLDTAEVVAAALGQLVVLEGSTQQPVTHVRIENVTFCHTRFTPPAHGYAESQATWHDRRDQPDDTQSVPVPSAVALRGTVACEFKNCRFDHLGGGGLSATETRDLNVARCTFRDIGANGVMIGSTGGPNAPLCENNRIENCLFEHCGAESFGAVGIWIGIASHTHVGHNEICNLPYTGISVGWRWDDTPTACHDNHIEHNHIHHVMQLLSDGGGIYTLGRQPGTVLAGNHIHDLPVNAGRAESNGMFIDEGSTDMQVLGNTIYSIARSPIRFHRAGKNTLTGNRLVAPPGTPTFRYNNANPADMTLSDNEELTAANWQPPADDERIKSAGPQPIP